MRRRTAPAISASRVPALERLPLGTTAQPSSLSEEGAWVGVAVTGAGPPGRRGVVVGVGDGPLADQLHSVRPVATGPPSFVRHDHVAQRLYMGSHVERVAGLLPGMIGQSAVVLHDGDSAAPAKSAPLLMTELQLFTCQS